MIKIIAACLRSSRDLIFRAYEQITEASGQREHAPALLFLFTILFYVAYLLEKQPGWVLGGEMWAEMATNYFPYTNSPSYFGKLLATDCGYIPVLQRMIALAGAVFNLPASSIPYFYTWSAIFVTGMLVGAFCLKQFRSLVRSDMLRFFTAIAILIVSDFETRTFINFTYFSAFFVAVVTALASTDDSKEAPWWAWFVPILMLSKPAVLAAIPALIIVAVVSRSRFRWIAVAAVSVGAGQILQMVISLRAGMRLPADDISFLSKIIASLKYFFGFLGSYALGPNFPHNSCFSLLAALFVLLFSALVVLKKRRNSGALALVGLSLLLFNVLLNCFALSHEWNLDMIRLVGPPVYRAIIVGFFGCILVTVGLISGLTDAGFSKSPVAVSIGALLFSLWFVESGWLSYGLKISREPVSPAINNSQWQHMADAIDSGTAPLCVPIDPLGWAYSRNCGILNSEPLDGLHGKSNGCEAVRSTDDLKMFEVVPPASLSEKTLVSFAVLVKPFVTQTTFVRARAIINLKGESRKLYSGGRDLPISGGVILLTGKDRLPIKNISSIGLSFSSQVEIASPDDVPYEGPCILWMGF